jgi:hypothetical protein
LRKAECSSGPSSGSVLRCFTMAPALQSWGGEQARAQQPQRIAELRPWRAVRARHARATEGA